MQLVRSSGNVTVEPPTIPKRPSLIATETKTNTLGVVSRLLTMLHEHDIKYCHWKSNEHVGAGLEGLTDLDVLADRNQGVELEGILADAGFKRFVTPPLKCYSGIEDYLGFDDDTGRIVHLHLHYELTIGEKHLKGYHVPWEGELLAKRHFDLEHGIYVANSAMELVLLLVRAALKSRGRDPVLKYLRSTRAGKNQFQREYDFLRARANKAEILDVAHHLLGCKTSKRLDQLLNDPNSRKKFGEFTTEVRSALRLHRSYSRPSAALLGWRREINWLLDGLSRRFLHHATPRRRISPRGGTVIVLLGSDGAGKSTQSKMLIEWLGKKLDALPIYFGSGDGPSAIYRLPLRWGQRLLQTTDKEPVDAAAASQTSEIKFHRSLKLTGVKRYLRDTARPLWALVLAQEKRTKIRQMVRARNCGMTIVCDRFPQSDVTGFNDGPLLAHWQRHPWRVCRWLAAWEAQPYATAVRTCPDLVLRLTIDPAAARQRRPEMNLAELERRVAAVQSINFVGTTTVVDIKAEKAPEEVTAAIKQEVWRKL